MKEILALIPARGGSKGIPRKNIRSFAGYPLIAWSIAAAQQASSVTRTIVSTDDEEIASVAREYGAETPFLRPSALAQDNTTDLPVFEHALQWLEANENYQPEIVVQLRPTSPIRPKDCVDSAIKILMEAVVITLAIFIGLSATVFITKKDFSFMRGALMIGTFAALGVIVASMIFGFHLGALFAGAVTDGLLLGHWHLVDRKLSREPIARINQLFLVGCALAAVAADLRGTGYPDLFIANDYGVSELFLNDGGRFREAGRETGVGYAPKSGMNASVGDVLNQGRFAIYVSNIS